MQKNLILASLLFLTSVAFAQSKFPKNQFSINGFRNPSIGLEYQRNQVSVHAGYYLTNFEKDVTTEFLKVGAAIWFLPVDKKEMPSSFYAGASYLRGFTKDYKDRNAFAVETGFRWYVWKGLNLRLGLIALSAESEELKINPTPSISFSFKF